MRGVSMSEFYNGISGFIDGLASLFSFLPVDWAYVLSRAFSVVIAWVIISLAIKIIGMFF